MRRKFKFDGYTPVFESKNPKKTRSNLNNDVLESQPNVNQSDDAHTIFRVDRISDEKS